MSSRSRIHPPSALCLLTVGIALAGACEEPQSTEPTLDDLPRLGHEEVARIGSVDDADIGFSRISRMDVAGGEIYVLETQDMQISRSGARAAWVTSSPRTCARTAS